MSVNLNPEKAFIFRIVHIDNVQSILDHGCISCRNAGEHDPNYVNIGNPDLIEKRSHRRVPIPPNGTLSDYVPFYFTPFSIMMFNIKTGYGGIKQRKNRKIAIFVSSIYRLNNLNLSFVFTNQHAYAIDTEFFTEPADLAQIDWRLLRSRNFKTDDADPGKQVRYQAEALVHLRVPLAGLLGIACYNSTVKAHLDGLLAAKGVELAVKVTPGWYF